MTIYIRPTRIVSGSNEPLPVKEFCYGCVMPDLPSCECDDKHEQALTTWKESCINFENQEGWTEFKPDTIIEDVHIKTDVIGQYKGDDKLSGGWVSQDSLKTHEWLKTIMPHYEYRTVLRIIEKA